jgi:acyl-CoA synthetase (AMP-forming)/AMP-acid ligase II
MEDYNIGRSLREVVSNQPDNIALVEADGKEYSFKELAGKRDVVAAGLHGIGIGRGDRVMLMVRPSADFIALTFALFELGAVVILIDPGMGYKNLLRCIGSVRPEYLIAIPMGIIFSRIFPGSFKYLRVRICVGGSLGPLSVSLNSLTKDISPQPFIARGDDLAAIIFTTGSTGSPKGVQYTHSIFHAQLSLIRNYYKIGPGEIDQPGFPLFALFSTALGAKAVIPDMNPSRPAKVNPEKFVRSLIAQNVSYSFGSPAIWTVVSRYCREKGIRIGGLKKILMAGAPVSGALIEQVRGIMAEDGEIHTPYGATESLPIASINDREILTDCWPLTCKGRGVCVGKSLPGITIRIIKPVSGEIADWQMVKLAQRGEIGEIVVKGAVVTSSYDNNDKENRLAKVREGRRIWHRMGDMGYIDENDRLWFCGRKAHIVNTGREILYSVCVEGVFNTHPRVSRSALVGISRAGHKLPVVLVEKNLKTSEKQLLAELNEMAGNHDLTKNINHFLVHPGFPVDIRHNAKIFREKLVPWAAKRIGSCREGL